MKKRIFSALKSCQPYAASFVFILVAVDAFANPLSAGANTLAPFNAVGRIDKVWIEGGVKVGAYNGMRIHVKFKVRDGVGAKCRIRANFATADGTRIVALTGADEYIDNSGHAVVTKEFTPPSAVAEYPDTKLAIPYWVLNLKESNENKMKFFVAVRCGEDKVADSDWVAFSLPLGKANR